MSSIEDQNASSASAVGPVSVAEMVAKAETGNTDADFAILQHAAGGHIGCQRAILDMLLSKELTLANLTRAELLARFVASRGVVQDAHRLAGVLWLSALECRKLGLGEMARDYASDALDELGILADAGDGQAIESMAGVKAQFPDATSTGDAPQEAAQPQPSPKPSEDFRSTLEALLAASFRDNETGRETRSQRLKARLADRAWSVRFYLENVWWALCDLGRALMGR